MTDLRLLSIELDSVHAHDTEDSSTDEFQLGYVVWLLVPNVWMTPEAGPAFARNPGSFNPGEPIEVHKGGTVQLGERIYEDVGTTDRFLRLRLVAFDRDGPFDPDDQLGFFEDTWQVADIPENPVGSPEGWHRTWHFAGKNWDYEVAYTIYNEEPSISTAAEGEVTVGGKVEVWPRVASTTSLEGAALESSSSALPSPTLLVRLDTHSG